MQYTVSDLLQDVGAEIDQDPTLPTGTDLLARIRYTNRAQNDWQAYYDWKYLRKSVNVTVAASMTSLGLPSDFDYLTTPLFDYSTGVDAPTKYLEITPAERFRKLSTDKYVTFGGNDLSGRFLTINPALASGASIVYDYQSFPSGLATLSDIVTCPFREFMAKRVEYYILKARSDPRFPQAKAESEDFIDSAIQDEDKPSGAMNNQVNDWMTARNFKPGRD